MKKSILKKWWFWVIIILVAAFVNNLVGGNNEGAGGGSAGTTVPTTVNEATPEQQNALELADKYLNLASLSYSGLIEILELYDCTNADAKYAADNCGADWSEQALGAAKFRVGTSSLFSYSYSGLIESLVLAGFTEEQATYGADNCDADWNEQAAKSAKTLLRYQLGYEPFSRDGLIEALESSGFTNAQAVHGAEANGF